jgi:hypothetical protein
MLIRTLKFFLAIVIPVCVIAFVFSMRTGFWDWCFGIDKVVKVTENFETSYAPDACHPVRPGDPAWDPILKLISKYSSADLPKDKKPKVFARFVAVLSQKTDLGQGKIAEWTAPSTPIALIYRDWPGQDVPPQDYRIVGTIGDLRIWINRSRDDFRFVMQDILFAILAIIIGTIIWFTEVYSPKQERNTKRKIDEIK